MSIHLLIHYLQVSSLVAFVIVSGYKTAVLVDDPTKFTHVDSMWRLLIGLGCVPAAMALYFRMTIAETPRFTMDIERNLDRASLDVNRILSNQQIIITEDGIAQRIDVPQASRRDFISHFSKTKNLRILAGTCLSWFALDVSVMLNFWSRLLINAVEVAFYGLGLNSAIVFTAIHFGSGISSESCDWRAAQIMTAEMAYRNMHNIALGNLIISVAGLLPGFAVCLCLIDKCGRKTVQLLGFVMLTVLFTIMGKFIRLLP
jgi:MFS transporter, PHS family, inorganic phosphate transporter